jgi:hypothetical protein
MLDPLHRQASDVATRILCMEQLHDCSYCQHWLRILPLTPCHASSTAKPFSERLPPLTEPRCACPGQ